MLTCSPNSYFSDVYEFLRVGNDTDSLNPLCLHFNGQHEIGSIPGAQDEPQLTIDFSQLNTCTLCQKAPGSQTEACHCIAPVDGTRRSPFNFAATISPQGHIFGQPVHQGR